MDRREEGPGEIEMHCRVCWIVVDRCNALESSSGSIFVEDCVDRNDQYAIENCIADVKTVPQ